MAKCTNLQPGFSCTPCPKGYTGRYSQGFHDTALKEHFHKQQCHDINECETDECIVNTDCINTIGSYHCECKRGYEWNTKGECTKVNDWCMMDSDCGQSAQCIIVGSSTLKCKCKIGWTGNGTVCGIDSDLDGFPDRPLPCSDLNCKQDNCINIPNSGQDDVNGNGIGDMCDFDSDGDGQPNDIDNCPLVHNPDQADTDGDEIGDACDNCPAESNTDQIQNICNNDKDKDGILNVDDNCPTKSNTDQKDSDQDGVGDACDNCPNFKNSDQIDIDDDLIGDVCDDNIDFDKDGIQDSIDNCPKIANCDQLDTDNDGR